MNLKDNIETWKTPLNFDNSYKIEKQDILKILEAARWAPSAENQQVWRFLVITNENIKKEIIKSVEEQDSRLTTILDEIQKPILKNNFVFSRNNYNALTDKYKNDILANHKDDLECAKSCSLFIICTHSSKYLGKTFGMTDIGAAIANILIICRELGFGVRWIRNFNRDLLQGKFKIPKSKSIDALLAIGKAINEEQISEIEKKKIEDFYFHNRWGNTLKNYDLFKKDLDISNYPVSAIDIILDRRSIRRYNEEKQISKGVINELIKAGMMVPLTINKP
ncbi:MAG: nitroreductase family protein, partial [Promethearchaeota archaeon]